MTYAIRILGNPATKGNHPRIFQRGNRFIRLPSETYMSWYHRAEDQMPFIRQALVGAPLPFRHVRVEAIWYRERNVGDLDNYEKGLGDFLERQRIIVNDKLILSWGESRLDKDKLNPRTDIWITPVEQET